MNEPLDISKFSGEVRDLLDYLKLLEKPSDNEALNFFFNLRDNFIHENVSKISQALMRNDYRGVGEVVRALDRFLNGRQTKEQFVYASFVAVAREMGFNFHERSTRDIIKERLMQLKMVCEPKIPTGTFIDVVGGLSRDDFVILAAGTGVGKTTWLLTIAKKLMRMKKDVLYVDWEAQANKPLSRLVSSLEYSEGDRQLWKDHPVIFVSVPFLRSPSSVVERFFLWMDEVLRDWRNQRMLHAPNNFKEYPDVIIIDYLYIASGFINISELDIFCRVLYAFSSELGIPIITASQLKKESNFKGGIKLPQIKDLFGLSAIAHSASRIFTIIKPPEFETYVKEKWTDKLIEAKDRLTGFIINTVKNRDIWGDNFVFFVEYDYNSMNILNMVDYKLRDKIETLMEDYRAGVETREIYDILPDDLNEFNFEVTEDQVPF